MFEFDKLCKEVEQLDAATYNEIISEKSLEVIAKLSDLTESNLSGLTIYSGLILGSVIADGKISEEEFAVIEPMMSVAVGHKVTIGEANDMMKYLRKDTKEYKEFIDAAVDLLGDIDDELKIDMITVCLLVCAIDGKVSHKEKKWLKQLIK